MYEFIKAHRDVPSSSLCYGCVVKKVRAKGYIDISPRLSYYGFYFI